MSVPRAIVPYDPFAVADTSTAVRFSDLPFIPIYSTGTGDVGGAIATAAATINAAGGGTIVFLPGAYQIYTVGTVPAVATIATFTNCQGLRLLGYGATLNVDPARTLVAPYNVSWGYIFNFVNCKGVTVDGFNVVGTVTATDIQSATVKGTEFCHFTAGCSDISLPNNTVKGVLAGAIFYNQDGAGNPTTPVIKNIHIGTLRVTNSWYGVAAEYGPMNMVIDALDTDTIHRSLFIYGASNVHANVRSKDPWSDDVKIWSSIGYGNSNIWVNYSRGTDSTNCGPGNSGIEIQFNGPTATAMRNIHLQVDAKYPGAGVAGSGQSLIMIRKMTNGGASFDTTDRGHVLDGLEISGYIENYPPYIGFGHIDCDPSCQWGVTLDTWRNIRIHDMTIVGSTFARLSCPSLKGDIIIDNVREVSPVAGLGGIALQQDNYSGGAITDPPRTGHFEIRASSFTNKYSNDANWKGLLLFEPSVGSTIYSGWSGMTITNRGTGGTVTHALPAATVGLEYTFDRMITQTMRIDPNGAEVIRGGGAGKYLSLDSDGAVVRLRCVIAGFWEIFSAVGTYTFEP